MMDECSLLKDSSAVSFEKKKKNLFFPISNQVVELCTNCDSRKTAVEKAKTA